MAKYRELSEPSPKAIPLGGLAVNDFIIFNATDGTFHCEHCDTGMCEHVLNSIAFAEEAQVLDSLINTSSVYAFPVRVPLYKSKGRVRTCEVTVIPRNTPSGRVGMLELLVSPDSPPAVMKPVSRGGKLFVKIGVIVRGQGIAEMKDLVISYVLTQKLARREHFRCTAIFHQMSDITTSEIDDIEIVLTGACVDCLNHRTKIDLDVPNLA